MVGPEPNEADLENEVSSIVEDIRHVFLRRGIEVAFHVGKLVIERLYGGDTSQWRHKGRKTMSLRKLGRHPRLPFSASWLSRALAVYTVSLRRPQLLESKNVGASHIYEVIGLPAAVQDLLLDVAERERWSVRLLRRKILSMRQLERPVGGGRERMAEVIHRACSVSRSSSDLAPLIEDIRELSAGDAVSLASHIDRAFKHLGVLRGALLIQLRRLDTPWPRTRSVATSEQSPPSSQDALTSHYE